MIVGGQRFACVTLALLTHAAAASPSVAIEPEQREVVVVSGRVWEGNEYREVFVPSTNDEMTVVAGQPSAITFVRTLEYYWPLSRRVYVDFQRQRDLVEGELVVRQDGREVARQSLDVYSIVYPEGAVNGNGQLLWGEEAKEAYAEYQKQEATFAREFAAARRAHTAYERHLLESGATRQPDETAETIKPPPPLPEPSLRLVTAPEPGFPIAFEPGTYMIALERDGQAVPGTGRRLRSISLEGSAILVADVVPSERWTRPLATNTAAARIYARPGAVFYLTMAEASRFDESDYLPVVSPQAEPVPGRSVWIRRRPADIANLEIVWGSNTSELVRGALKVEQTRGSSYGYTVRAARDGETADLDAFSISVPSEPSMTRGSIVTAPDTQWSFAREVVVVQPRRSALALGMAFLPFAGFLAFAGWKRIVDGRFHGHRV